MSRNASGTEKRIDGIEKRDARALTECMSVLEGFGDAGPGEYVVVSESGSQYEVDVLTGTCDCPDHVHRSSHCKHLRGAEFASGRREIPAWVDRNAIENTLGDHIDAGPVFADELEPEPDAIAEPTTAIKLERTVMADGGVVAESDPEGPTTEDGRPEACSCLPSMDSDGLGCFACYRAGFPTANPDVEEDDDE